MSRKKIKQVDAIRQKTLENVIEKFLRHCRLKNLSPRTLEYYEEDLGYFQRSVPVESVREVTREVMEDFIDHEMQKGNRITAINTRLRGLRVFFRFCQEREYMGDIGLKLLKEDETIKEPYTDAELQRLLKQPESGNAYEGYTFRCNSSRLSYFYDEESWSVLSEEELSLYREFRFIDVTDPNDYFYEPVYWAVANGITTGKTDTTFDPWGTCMRSQIVTFLWRYYGEPEPTASNPFTDVKESDGFYKAVLWAVENGLTTGKTPTTFDPWGPCTRAQVVTFLWRAAGKPAPSTTAKFKDLEKDAYYVDAVSWAVEKGITKGTTDTTFSPYTACKRAQVVTFLYRASN